MVKFVWSFLLIFFILTPFSFANSDAKLQSQYGQDLTHAPFFFEGGLPPRGAGPGGASSRRTPLDPLPAGEREILK